MLKKNTREGDPTTIVDTIEEHGSHNPWIGPTPSIANLVCDRVILAQLESTNLKWV
jgi:hypothetical protein